MDAWKLLWTLGDFGSRKDEADIYCWSLVLLAFGDLGGTSFRATNEILSKQWTLRCNSHRCTSLEAEPWQQPWARKDHLGLPYTQVV